MKIRIENGSDNLKFFLGCLNDALEFYAYAESTHTPMTPTRKAVYENIRKAFRGVSCKREKSVLIASAAKDDYLTEIEIEPLTKIEERTCWERISPCLLYSCQESLSYVGPEAFRFLIPAYMCAALKYRVADAREFEFHIGEANKMSEESLRYSEMQGKLLNKEQKKAISYYLRNMYCEDNYIDVLQINDFQYDKKHDYMGISWWEYKDFINFKRSISFESYVNTLFQEYIGWIREEV